MAEHFPTPWRMDPINFTIYAQDVPKGPARVADMRGWGYLTGKGHGALALSDNEAIAIQQANAAFIVKAVNEYAGLVQRLVEATRLINEGNATLAKLIDAETALKRIQSLDEKNVPKYAQQIAHEVLSRHVGRQT